jgi:hypothetical protein
MEVVEEQGAIGLSTQGALSKPRWMPLFKLFSFHLA